MFGKAIKLLRDFSLLAAQTINRGTICLHSFCKGTEFANDCLVGTIQEEDIADYKRYFLVRFLHGATVISNMLLNICPLKRLNVP